MRSLPTRCANRCKSKAAGGAGAFDLLSLCAVTALTASSLHTFVSAAAAVLKTAAVFMQGFIPVYAALLAFSGRPGAALSYQTLCFALAQGISLFASGWCVPLLGLFFALGISFSLNETVNTPAFLAGVNKLSGVVLGLVSGGFSGVLSFRQVLAGAADSAAGKSVRFLLGSLVPVVGSAVGDAYSAVLGSIDLIRGSAIVFAFLVLLVLHLPVLLQLLHGGSAGAQHGLFRQLSDDHDRFDADQSDGSADRDDEFHRIKHRAAFQQPAR